MRNKGNRKAQRKRRIERFKNLPKKQEYKYETIDGNLTYYPIAYCKHHGAWLTQGIADTHRCLQRKCNGYEPKE